MLVELAIKDTYGAILTIRHDSDNSLYLLIDEDSASAGISLNVPQFRSILPILIDIYSEMVAYAQAPSPSESSKEPAQ